MLAIEPTIMLLVQSMFLILILVLLVLVLFLPSFLDLVNLISVPAGPIAHLSDVGSLYDPITSSGL